MKLKTIIYLAIGGIFIGLAIYYFFPYTPIPEGITIDKIVISKSQHQLLAYSQGQKVKIYPISLGKDPVGAKLNEGDYKTPEGFYVINEKNPKSSFHKSLGISYPNQQDLANAKQVGKSPGGDIKIHGLRNDQWFIGKFQRWKNWTTGCIGLTNKEIDDLYMHTPLGTRVEIRK
jgi:murein L,D-transpeptidase YafK